MQSKEVTKPYAARMSAFTLIAAFAAAGSLLLGDPHPAQSAPAGSGWQTYKDAHLGFAVQRPAGWIVRADEHSILVQSPDHRETVLAEVFTAPPGESAEEHLNRLPGDRAALFPEAQMSGVAPEPSQGEEVSAALSYQAAGEPGQGRVLCSVIHGKGLLFALAAPGARFAAARPILTRIVRSLRFLVPAGTAAHAGGSPAAQMAAITRSLHFVAWTDPREKSFHVGIPQGWKADGGAFRFGPTDVRIAYQVMSPTKDMTVLIGDPRLPSTFQAPNAFTEQTGMRDGTNGLLHYMSAVEFNRWYLESIGRQALDNLTVGEEHPLPEISRQRTEMAQQSTIGPAQVEASVAITEFSGRSKLTGKPTTGIIIGSTQRTTRDNGGMDMTNWFASPIILACTDNADKDRYQQTLMAVLAHLMQSYQVNAAWDNRRAQEISQATGQAMQRTAARSQQIAKDSDAARSASMGAYWGHVNAGNERQRGFVNYIGGRTDVTDGSGTSYNVQGGSQHYYKNSQTGDILGTDSAYSPGVDFTPLTER